MYREGKAMNPGMNTPARREEYIWDRSWNFQITEINETTGVNNVDGRNATKGTII